MTVWTHSQGVYPLRKAHGRAARLAPRRCAASTSRARAATATTAPTTSRPTPRSLARAVPGRPVRLQWMREQEHGWEPLGPAMVVEMQAALDADGSIVDWRHDVWSNTHSTRPGQRRRPAGRPAGRSAVRAAARRSRSRCRRAAARATATRSMPCPTRAACYHFVEQMPVRVSALRGLGAQMNVFAIESFMDELALAAGTDPVAFRLARLEDERAREVVRRAADRFGWRRAATAATVGHAASPSPATRTSPPTAPWRWRCGSIATAARSTCRAWSPRSTAARRSIPTASATRSRAASCSR